MGLALQMFIGTFAEARAGQPPSAILEETMTIDERIEALAQTVELLGHAQRETDERIRHLAIIAEQNETRAAKMMEAITSQQARMARFEATTYRSFEDIRDSLQRLERIAIAHERRLDEIQS
jgi:hypothetical protein